MRILLPGGSGQVGTLLARHLNATGHDVIVLSRNPKPQPWQTLYWDGLTPGPWTTEVDRADAVIHLSGRSVNCRYTPANRADIFASRIDPTLLLGRVIAASPTPPRIWMNASTSTIYRHSPDEPPAFTGEDEYTGILGDLPAEHQAGGKNEPASLPETWSFSIDVAHRWEQAFAHTSTPHTRKIRLRSSMTMSPDPGGVFSVFSRLARLGLAGTQGPGTQYVSWIHEADYCAITDLLLTHPEITDETNGIINLTAPNPLPNRDFLRILRQAWHQPIGLPAPGFALELGARFMQTETELILKSRRALPTLLQRHNYQFQFPTWPEAVVDLVARSRHK